MFDFMKLSRILKDLVERKCCFVERSLTIFDVVPKFNYNWPIVNQIVFAKFYAES